LVRYVEPFVFLSTPGTAAQQLVTSQTWSAKLPRGQAFSHSAPRRPGRIRIGYLSADFRKHATAFLMAELFERHNRDRFEIYAYSYGYDDHSDVRQRLINAFDHFVEFRSTPLKESAQRIFEDDIDILIDLKGYTGGVRTEILVDRPAPIQVNYVGYPGTMGADFIDYIIGDPFVTPMEHQANYSEKIVQLPGSYQPNDTKRPISDKPFTRAQFGLPEQGFVFCSFNGAYKISPTFFAVWMRLLNATPGSVLWMLATNSIVEANLRREAAAHGVAPERLIFTPGLDNPEHLARHRFADLFVDTAPINAHTTASDALWAGLPVVTCAGEPFASRVAGSLLRAVGLPELITTRIEDYEALALQLAANPDRLREFRDRLARNRLSSPLFDIGSYTRALESAYQRMFDIRQAGQPPQAFAVDPTT
jgi:protein O-GlcNAc transferase